MSIMENAQQLAESAGQVTQDAIGANTAAASAIDNVAQNLERTRQICEESTSTAAMLLGEGHAAVGTIVGSAGTVTDAVLNVQNQAEALRAAIIDLDQLVIAHADVMISCAQAAMGGGA